MPNLRDIKSRIKSIQNTQKITQAMKMVAAAKVKRAENLVKAARPFTEEIGKAFKKTVAQLNGFESSDIKSLKPIDNYPALLGKREIKSVGLLVISSNKGLSGAYNANITRKTLAKIKEINEQGLDVKLFVVGNKSLVALKRAQEKMKFSIIKSYTKLPAIPTVGSSSIIAEDIAEAFVENKIDSLEIITTKFKSMLSFSIEEWHILPAKEEKRESNIGKIESEMLFEPNCEMILQKIVPMYITNSIYQALIEAAASELASRMNAMSNAATNAQDIIRVLTTAYNKARQAAITQEIIEVASGADALKG